MLRCVSPEERKHSARRIAHVKTHIHHIFADPEEGKRGDVGALPQRKNEPQYHERNLPERTAENVECSPEPAEEEMARLVDRQESKHPEHIQHCRPRFPRRVLVKCCCGLVEEVGKPEVDGELENHPNRTIGKHVRIQIWHSFIEHRGRYRWYSYSFTILS